VSVGILEYKGLHTGYDNELISTNTFLAFVEPTTAEVLPVCSHAH